MSQNPSEAQEERNENEVKTSQNFPDSSTSDLVLKSKDNTLFYIHTRNLSVHSSVFADANDCVTKGGTASTCQTTEDKIKFRETVEMEETGETLELLLQFIYPQPQPSLAKMPFDTLYPLAEAVEKWKIYSAMTLCYMYMSRFSKSAPLSVLRYAAVHGYSELANEAVKHTVNVTASRAYEILPVDIFIRWALYRDAVNPPAPASEQGLQWIVPPSGRDALHPAGGFVDCRKWEQFEAALRPYFTCRALKVDVNGLFEDKKSLISGCYYCERRCQIWEKMYRREGVMHSASTPGSSGSDSKPAIVF